MKSRVTISLGRYKELEAYEAECKGKNESQAVKKYTKISALNEFKTYVRFLYNDEIFDELSMIIDHVIKTPEVRA